MSIFTVNPPCKEQEFTENKQRRQLPQPSRLPEPPAHLRPIIEWLQRGVPHLQIALSIAYTIGSGRPLRLLDAELCEEIDQMSNAAALVALDAWANQDQVAALTD